MREFISKAFNLIKKRKKFFIALAFVIALVFFLTLGVNLYIKIINWMYLVKAGISYIDVIFLKGWTLVSILVCVATTCIIYMAELWILKKLKLAMPRRVSILVLGIELGMGFLGGIILAPSFYLAQFFSASILDAYIISFIGPSGYTPSIAMALVGNYSIVGGLLMLLYLTSLFPLLFVRFPAMTVVSIFQLFGGFGLLLTTYFIPYFAVINGATPSLMVLIITFGILLIISGVISMRSEYAASRLMCLFILGGIMGATLGIGYVLRWQANYREWEGAQVAVSLQLTDWAMGVEMNNRDIADIPPIEYHESLVNIPQYGYGELATLNLPCQPWEEPEGFYYLFIGNDSRLYYAALFQVSSSHYSWANIHMLCTHAESFHLIDPNIVANGHPLVYDVPSSLSILNISRPIGFYYGDSERYNFPLIISNNVNECGNVSYNYSPDYVLEGLDAVIFHLFGFATGGDISFMGMETGLLAVRNVRQRVANILMPGIAMDNEPYIVVLDGKIFLTFPLFLSLPLPPMIYSNFYRLIGWCLVNVENGSMIFYKYWNIDPGILPLIDAYSWSEPKYEFIRQAKFPTILSQKIMETDARAHVKPPYYSIDDWRSGTYFYLSRKKTTCITLPELSNDWCIIGDSSYLTSPSTLGAIYLFHNGAKCGIVDVYRNEKVRCSAFVAQEIAERVASSYDDVFAGDPIFLPVESTLCWYVPLYHSEGTETFLYKAILVQLHDRQIFEGEDVVDAYARMAFLFPQPSGNISFVFHTPSIILTPNSNGTLKYVIESNISETTNISVVLASFSNCFHVYTSEEILPQNTSGTLNWIIRNTTISLGEIIGNTFTINCNLTSTPRLLVVLLKIVDSDTYAVYDLVTIRIWILERK
ncbi:MAG: hypothetical protein QXL15_00455 [Candidatus Korarchaeota archaeon]